MMLRTFKNQNTRRVSTSLPSMSIIGSAQPDVVKIKVYKPNKNSNDKGYESGSSKIFCIDPRLASFETIQCLIAQTFDIKSDFKIIAIQKRPPTGFEKSTIIWSDLDLEIAIKNVELGSYLRLCYELIPREESLDDWDFIAINDFNTNIRWIHVDNRSIVAIPKQSPNKKPSALGRAISWMYGGHERQSSKPVCVNDFKNFFDSEGRLIHANELRQAIYEGGIEPSCRKIIWCHLLNIYPGNMTRLECHEYLKSVSIQYEKLKGRWKEEKTQKESIRSTMRTIHTDVLRTDRTFGFYATSGDGNINLQSLYNILVTYCTSHPNIAYRQGMNEYVSTLLYIMRDESLAYLSLCAIMKRIRANFATDGVAMATKFHYLKILLQAVDPVYWNFLESCDAVNLYFAYRWLLLECKREFPFNEALRVMEVMWATLPIDNDPPKLSELYFLSSTSSDNPLEDILRSTSNRSLQRRALSCPQLSTIDEIASRTNRQHSASVIVHSNTEQLLYNTSLDYKSNFNNNNNQFDLSTKRNSSSLSTKSRERSSENSFLLSDISDFDLNTLSICTSNDSKIANNIPQDSLITNWAERLPQNTAIWLDEDNSFLFFLCISILLAHRRHLLKQKNLDAQDISMHFDRYRRRHPAEKLLACARTLYGQYLQWARKKRMLDDLNSFSAS